MLISKNEKDIFMPSLRLVNMVLLGATALVASIQAGYTSDTTWQGYVVDKQCADSVRKDHDPTMFIQHHTKDCALMANCRLRGYAVYSKGSWLDLDKRGNELAIQLIKRSKRQSGFYVEIVGMSRQSTLSVKSMKEMKYPPKPHAESEEN